ncbi:MAG: hypothetical protein IPJ61_18955 [Tessaracoccus sp.]|uniref:hypothetical protein n=1 Tax=Tessaracoccus sp. TaxID=1971211 RepID=UPI001EC20DBE|nr:hypothetical protein [Tessaracoccus sp.]MBK7823066.1 hypothetical protein [Tessaracoccus sp.]
MESLPALAVWGPLGIWAIVVTGAVIVLYKELAKARDACVAETAKLNTEHANRLVTIGKEHAATVAGITAEYTRNLQAAGERYDRLLTEATQRSFTAVTTLSDKLSGLVDSLTRHHR